MSSHPCRVDGAEATIVISPEGIDGLGEFIPWHAVDTVSETGTAIDLGVARGLEGALTVVRLSHLGAQRDEVAREIRQARGAARRPSLAQSDLAVTEEFTAHVADTVIDVVLLPNGMIVEQRGALAAFVPWGLVADVQRDGYAVTFRLRQGEPVTVAGLGERTDEFEDEVARLRLALSQAARAAMAEWDTAGLAWEDGWALTDPAAVRAVASRGSADECSVLGETCSVLRAGVFTEGGTQDVPFLIGTAANGVTIVEGVGEEDRATYLFATSDVDRVNAALLRLSFRRELLVLPQGELGRWAAAIRTQPEVAWLRSVIQGRVVHDTRWETKVREATAPGRP